VRYVEVVARLLIATMFVVAVAGKVAPRSAFPAFARSLGQMGVLPQAAVMPVARAVVAGEAVTVVSLLIPVPAAGAVGFVMAIVLLAGFITGITVSLRRGNRTPCRCFGATTTPLGPLHIVRSVLLIAVCGLGLAGVLSGGRLTLGYTLVCATLGLLSGVLVAMLDDIAVLLRPMP
jgi:hypothetical protein